MDLLEAPGSMMRRLRLERNLTLRTAAEMLDVSPSALSRLERDMRTVERSDVDAIVQAYGLLHWESSNLHMSAGLAPAAQAVADGKAAWRVLTERLGTLTLPAYVMDQFNYVVAWNGAMQEVWEWPAAPTAPIQALDDLFSPRVHRLLGDDWQKTAQLVCRHLYLRSLRVAGDPRFQKSLSAVARKHGSEFITKWNEALAIGEARGLRDTDYVDLVLRRDTRAGMIEYMVLQSALHTPLPLELHVHLPIGPDSARRHEQIVAKVATGQVVLCPRTGIR